MKLDPAAVLETSASALTDAARNGAFKTFARKSPEEALQWLKGSSLDTPEKEKLLYSFKEVHVITSPSMFLDDWDLIEASQFSGQFALLEPEGIAGLISVVNLPQNSEIQERPLDSIIFSSLLERNGLARYRIESLGIEPEKVIRVLESWEDLGSEETLEWAIDLGRERPKEILDLSESFMAKFAQRNLTRAGEWLGDFEDSPLVKDRLIGRYAMVLGSVDPVAALPWIERIQDQQQRESIRLGTLLAWKAEDPQAYARWLTK